MPDDDAQPTRLGETVRDAVAGGAGALIGTTIAGPAGGVAGGVAGAAATPALEHTFRWLDGLWRKRSAKSGTQVLSDAATAADLTPEELGARLAGDPKRLQLAGLTLAAATMTTDEDKLRALARALAAGVTDDALVDPEMLAVAALTDMEAPHIKVLQYMAAPGRRDPETGRVWHQSWTATYLPLEMPEVKAVIGPVLATLARHALIEDATDLAGALDKRDKDRERRHNTSWKAPKAKVRVTDFGQHCLDLLDALAQEEQQPVGRYAEAGGEKSGAPVVDRHQ